MLDSFFLLCERHFRFLETQHHFSYISGIAEHKMGRRVIKPHQAPKSPFRKNVAADRHALTLYEKHPTSLEISLLPEPCTITAALSYDSIQRFDLEQILNAAHVPTPLLHPSPEQDNMNQALEAMAATIHEHAHIVLTPPPALLKKALQAQDIILEQRIRAQFQRDLSDATQQAARAFVKKDFRRVIEILMPYRDHLGHADLSKLEAAKKQLLNL